ncbi:MAG: porin family protein [candidate division Zixibacteria bacterium]|nr:porin family protein [candidate division Zixibacteria bacterium]
MRHAIVMIALVLLVAATGWTEGAKPVFYVGGGISMPMKPDAIGGLDGSEIGIKDMYKNGTHIGGGVGFQISPNVEIIGWVSYNSFAFDDDGFSQALEDEFIRLSGGMTGFTFDINTNGTKLELIEIMGDVKFTIPVGQQQAKFKPFILGGLGMTNAKQASTELEMHIVYPPLVDTTISETIPEQTETKLAFNIGAGFDYMVSPTVGIFADVRYAQVAVEGDPIGYLPIRAGLIFKLGQ